MDLNDMDVYVPAGGYFVSEKQLRIAEIIQDYDPTLELTWVPPDKREPGDKPFAVVHRPSNGPEYIVCYADDCDERLLARVFSMDATKHDVMSDMEAHNAALKAVQMKKQMEEMEEAHDLSRSILKSHLNTYRHNGVKYQ